MNEEQIEQFNYPSSTESNPVQPLDDFQLKFPLDVISKKVIKDILNIYITTSLKNTEPQTTANYSSFFIADSSLAIISAMECHGVAGTDAGYVALQIEKISNGVALGSGSEIFTTATSLKTTANTIYFPKLKDSDVSIMKSGDRLALKLYGTPTSIKNLVVTLKMKQL